MTTYDTSKMSSMKAVRISSYGSVDALAYENVPQPVQKNSVA